MVAHYEDILNHLPDAICTIDANTNKVTYINDTFSDQLLSRNLIVEHSFESQILQEDSREKFQNCIKDAKLSTDDVAIGLCKSLSSVGKEKFPLYKNYFWVARKINDDCIMLRGNVDVAKYSVPTDADFTYTEELLDFFQNAPIALHWLSGTGHILWANNAELDSLGYTKEEYIGHHIMEFCPDEEVALNKVFTELSAGKTIQNAPFKFRTKSGETKYLVVDSNVSFNPDGTFKHTRCFIRDDTQRRIEEKILEMEFKHMKSLNSSKDSFIRRIFHDIKTPLHVISDSLNEIEDSINKNIVPKLEDVTFIQQNIDSILSTAEDINYSLEFGEGRTIAVSDIPFDIESSLRDLAIYVENIERKSSQKISYIYEFDKCLELKDILADCTIYRVLFHLIRNAVRFSPNDSHIKIEVIRDDKNDDNEKSNFHSNREYYQFKVSNNVDTDVDLKSINNCFHTSYSSMNTSYNVDGSSKHVNKSLISEKGLGLGLYVSFNLIQAMGGMLECTKNNENSVTLQFTLSLTSTKKETQARAIPNSMKIQSDVGKLLRRKSFEMWTNMCDADAAKSHVIEDDVEIDDSYIISRSMKSSSMSSKALASLITPRIEINRSNSIAVNGSTKSFVGSYKGLQNVMSFVDLLEENDNDKSRSPTNELSAISASQLQPLPPMTTPNMSSKDHKPNQAQRILMQPATEVCKDSPLKPTTMKPSDASPRSNMAHLKKQQSRLIPLQDCSTSSKSIPSQFSKQKSGRFPQTGCVSNQGDNVVSCNTSPEKNPRILVVDDSPMCQRVLIRILNKHGYDVDTADNGQEAVDKLSIEPCIYKACLMDLRMPIMDGITATKICREKFHLKFLPIIVITAELGEHIKNQVQEAGANYLIPKPAAAGDILLAIG